MMVSGVLSNSKMALERLVTVVEQQEFMTIGLK